AAVPHGAAAYAYSDAPIPLDPRYTTAQPGDTVRFVNVRAIRNVPNYCSMPRDQVLRDNALSYPAVVAAVSGKTVFAVDLRSPAAASFLSETGRAYAHRAIAIADPLVIPVFRELFDARYEQPNGGGGRRFAVINDDYTAGAAAIASDGLTDQPQAWCGLASEMQTTFFNSGVFTPDRDPRVMAGVLIHELAHVAAYLTLSRERVGTAGFGFLSEPWSMVAEEVAMRMASGQPTRARLDRVGPSAPYDDNIDNGMWSELSGTGIFAHVYTQAPLMLMYTRELLGHEGFTPETATLFQRLVRRGYAPQSNESVMSALAAEAGTTSERLLDDYMIAAATDDLVAEDVALARRLPQLWTWDRTGGGATRNNVSRRMFVSGELSVAPSGYAALYLMGDGERGVSLELGNVSGKPFIARLIRLR
ncbi:MAG TPA: hypothetical protein VK358_09750, partial [Longimicrobium sp.]|nr:hypothetical protein [Longimicrobium sp.]